MGLFDGLFGPPSRDAFARRMIDALRREGRTGEIRYDAATFSLRADPSDRINLGNVYDEYCSVPRSRRSEVLRRFAGAFRSGAAPESEPYEQARTKILPRVRERSYLDIRRLMIEVEGNPAPPLPHRILGEHFIVTLVYDLPDAMMELGTDRLEGWGVDFDRVLADARENLWARSKERLREVAPGLWSSPWKDNYDATRLLLHDLIWQYKVAGDPVAALPHRDTLLVGGADDEAALGRMFSLAETALDQPRPMSGLPLRLRDREWIPLELPAGHPHARALRRLRVLTLARDYAEQKNLLDVLAQKKGDDVFVAAYTGIEKPEGEVSSYCVWSEGLPSLLPEADEVGFFRPSLPKDRQVVGLHPWARVRSVLGDLMTRERLYPERYRVRKFPTAEQLASLGG